MARIYKTPFAATGDKEVLASTDQPDGKVSLPAGWTNDYQLPDTDPNYRPVGRAEMNGVFNEVTEALGEVQLNGFAEWQALSGGYPLNAEIKKNGVVYHSMIAANTDDPSVAGANWQPTNSYGVTVKSGLTTGTVTLTAEEAARGTVILSGNLTGNVTVIFPKYLSQWIVRNNTTGAFSVTAKTLAGTGVIVPQGESRYIFGDGSGLINSGDFVPISGAVTKSGVLTLTSSPIIPDATAPNEAMALGQIDAPIKQASTSRINPITASMAANAMTLTLNPTVLDFRSAALNNGAVITIINYSAVSLVISSGSTLGSTNAVQTKLAVIAINNAGTIELATVNLLGGVDIGESGVITTVAEGGAGAADSATTIYSTTARTGVAYRLVGFVEYTQATAGTYATAPSLVNGCSDALAKWVAGYGRTWQDVSASRAATTTYTNTTGRDIEVSFTVTQSVTRQAEVDGVNVCHLDGTLNSAGAMFIVPNGSEYRINGSVTRIVNWAELR